MDDIHYKRLEWIAKCPIGQANEELFPMNNWGKPLSETAQAALDEIRKLQNIVKFIQGKDT